MNLFMLLTHNSLATMIAWVSTCLLAGSISTFFGDTARLAWMLWGSFGLAAAVGLDLVARAREHARMELLKRTATLRFDRDVHFAAEENEAIQAIGEAVARMLAGRQQKHRVKDPRRGDLRYSCDLPAELFFSPSLGVAPRIDQSNSRNATVTNLSKLGFELAIDVEVPHQQMIIRITANSGQELLLGEILWSGLQPNGSVVAGGRFLDALPAAKPDGAKPEAFKT